MGVGEGDMEIINVHYLTVLEHAWIQGGRCQRTLRFKNGFPPELNFPQYGTKGGEGIGSSKSSYAALVPGKFDALERLEMFGTLGTLREEGGTRLLRGS